MARIPLRALAVALLLAGLGSQGAAASGYKVIYSFCSQDGCADGDFPHAALIRDPSGTLYGTTESGGAGNGGTIFALVPDGTDWQYQVLYSFCSQPFCVDGYKPLAGLIEDGEGNLYGTASDGGSGRKHFGAVFKLTHNAARTAWTYSEIYGFCTKHKKTCPDGVGPNSALTYRGAASGAPYDGVSPLYGTTLLAGLFGGGVVYQLTPGSGGTWTQSVVYAFCSQSACIGNYAPAGGLIVDGGGNLFLNTSREPFGGDGAIVELTQKHGTWKATQLHAFCSEIPCDDGGIPLGQLLLDAAGNVIGTTQIGGKNNEGTLFELSPTKRKWKERVLYSFCSEQNCADGASPIGGVTMDGAGNLLGTTEVSGSGLRSGGTVFRYGAGTLDVLYSLCQQDSCADGNFPVSAPIVDPAGNIFGTTVTGGAAGHGVIYEITP